MSYQPGTLVKRVAQGSDWDVNQTIKVWGYVIFTPNGAAVDTALKFWETDKTGNPVWEDLLDTSVVGERLAVNFSHPMKIADALVEVTGAGGVAYIRYD